MDQSRQVQEQVIQFADFDSYGPSVDGNLGRRFDSCHGLKTERQFVAPVGSLFSEMLAEFRQVKRQGGQ